MDSKPRRRGRPPGTHPPAVFTGDFHLLLTPEQKEWVIENGGSEMVRNLIANEQRHREALRFLLVERVEAGKPMLHLTWRNPEEHDEEGSVSWDAYGDPFGTQSAIITFSVLGGEDCRIQLSAILRIQEPGDDGTVLWEK